MDVLMVGDRKTFGLLTCKKTSNPTLMALVRRWSFNIFPSRACGATTTYR